MGHMEEMEPKDCAEMMVNVNASVRKFKYFFYLQDYLQRTLSVEILVNEEILVLSVHFQESEVSQVIQESLAPKVDEEIPEDLE